MKSKVIQTLVLISILTLAGCEGFKVLTLHNASNYETKITTYPTTNGYDSTVYIIQPDSSADVLSVFTSFIGSNKIVEENLDFEYLRIETQDDTIIANSKEQIIELIYGRNNKFKSKGRHRATIDIK